MFCFLFAKKEIRLAIVVPRTLGYIALDNVRILNGDCPAARVCDFEDATICGYQNDATADFTWSRHKGSTSSSLTGATNGLFIEKIEILILESFLFPLNSRSYLWHWRWLLYVYRSKLSSS